MTFEQVVIDALAELASVLKAAEKRKTSASALHRMLDSGNIRDIEKKLTEAEEELSKALEGIRAFKELWQKNGLDGYFGSPEYTTELTECLDESGVDYHQVGNAFYVYLALVRLEQDSKEVRIDKKTEPRLRPKTLAKILYDIQNRPSKFRQADFCAPFSRCIKHWLQQILRSRKHGWASHCFSVTYTRCCRRPQAVITQRKSSSEISTFWMHRAKPCRLEAM